MGAGNGGRKSLAVPRFAMRPARAVPPMPPRLGGLRADQTCLALFFFLRLGAQTRFRASERIAGTGTAGKVGPPSRRVAEPEEGAEERGKNTKPPESPDCCCGCRGDSCCGWRSARCSGDCSRHRRAQAPQTAWPEFALQPRHGTRKMTKISRLRRRGKSPPHPLQSRRCRGQRSE